MKIKFFLVGALMLMLVLVLAACQQPAQAPPAEPCPECPDCPDVEAPECPEVEAPECPECPEVEVEASAVEVVPFGDVWAASPHNDAEAEAFVHWDEDDPAEIPESCAKCHSTPGYLDFLGEDGSEAGVVNSVAEIGTTITCVACHNESAEAMTSVTFPSGVMVEGLGPEARCMQCHQGRASLVQVNEAIEAAGLTDDVDGTSEELGFINIHYYAAAPTLYGTITKGGYEYDGKSYDFKNDHVAGYDTCLGCHDQHTLELKVEECAVCHTDVASVEDAANIRMAGSKVDYDGDGDVDEGISQEIAGLQEMLYGAIQSYASEVAGSAAVYDSHAYPYFFIDTNEDGEAGEDEANYGNQFATWTPRLLKAAYNYQTSQKDPGAYAHGGKYIIQLLYDSIEDLNEAISTPVDLSNANRVDAGHFAGSEEAFRHWDEDGMVETACAKCHSAAGLPRFLHEGVNISEPLANGFNCATCHDDVSTFTRFVVDEVKFPSGEVLTFGEGDDNNLCMNCHQGRNSKVTIDGSIGDTAANQVMENVTAGNANTHYFAAGATLFGSDALGAYQYDDQSYNARNKHVAGFETCLSCHDGHGLEVKAEACSACHTNVSSVEDLEAIRMTAGDFDGDGDEAEGIAGELETIHEALLAAIEAYAADTVGTGILYDSHAYPYWFADTNGNGEVDADEINYGNQYTSWTPELLKAAYNYQWAAKDPGAFAHNPLYILQVLYDSLGDVGGDTAGMTRPPVKASE